MLTNNPQCGPRDASQHASRILQHSTSGADVSARGSCTNVSLTLCHLLSLYAVSTMEKYKELISNGSSLIIEFSHSKTNIYIILTWWQDDTTKNEKKILANAQIVTLNLELTQYMILNRVLENCIQYKQVFCNWTDNGRHIPRTMLDPRSSRSYLIYRSSELYIRPTASKVEKYLRQSPITNITFKYCVTNSHEISWQLINKGTENQNERT